jgi:hypothetical protein
MPFPYAIQDFVNEIPNVIFDDAVRLGGVDGPQLPALVKRAILQRYTLDKPLDVVSDIAGNGTNYLSLPTAPAGGPAVVFEPEWSILKSLEFPIGQQPPQMILDSDFRVYRTPAGYQILINFDTPQTTEFLRATWTARHLPDGSTVPDADFYAVVDFAGSLAAEKLATFYVGTGDASIQADVVNYRSKSQEMLNVAKALRKRYFNHMGIDETAVGGGDEQKPAIAIGNQYLEQNSGVDRLVHGKYTR